MWIGGIETALVNLLNHFDYESYEVTLLVLHAELDMLDKIHLKCRILIADREKVVTFRNSYKYKKLYHLTEFTDNPSEFTSYDDVVGTYNQMDRKQIIYSVYT